MHVPVRLLNAVRTDVAPGLVLAAAVSTAVLSATPLLLPELIEAFDVDNSAGGLVSGVQLAGFVLTSFLAGRFVTPSGRLFIAGLVVLASANASSAIVESFPLFLAVRGMAGLALGVLTWLTWASVFGDSDGMGDIAVVGPVAALVASPLFGFLLVGASYRWVFGLLAAASLVPLMRVPTFVVEESPLSARQRGGAPVAFVLVGALGMLTMGASSVFVYGGVIARTELGMTSGVLSLVYAANAAAGIPSARWRGRRPAVGLWFALAGVCAVGVATATSASLLALAIVVWGFAFWFGVPGAYKLLSDRSTHPADRAGDAQAAMAVGRIIGPLAGGALVSAGSFTMLGLVGGGIMVVSGLVVALVEAGGARWLSGS